MSLTLSKNQLNGLKQQLVKLINVKKAKTKKFNEINIFVKRDRLNN